MTTAGRTGTAGGTTAPRRRCLTRAVLVATLAAAGGCISTPAMLPADRQTTLDRRVVEYPSGTALVPLVRGLNCPTALCLDGGDLLVAESGVDGSEPHIFGYHLADGSSFNVYPHDRTVSFFPTGFAIYGPIGGMVATDGAVYVSHRDRDGYGVITAFGYDGSHRTILSGLPARGDYGVTDLAVGRGGRLYFGIGAATNSGVVGLDNYDTWAHKYPDVHDEVFSPTDTPVKLLGFRFDTANPAAGIGASDIVVTTPFQPFGSGNQTRIRPVAKPNSAICSVKLDGGDYRVEAYGLRHPRGLAIGHFDRLYATNDGKELRGTRPVANDPDALDLIPTGGQPYYGGTDYTTNGRPIGDPEFRPPLDLAANHGYDEISALIDAPASGLRLVDFNVVLRAVFPSQSGAAKLAFVPADGPLKGEEGKLVVALDGDRGPFATGYQKLLFHPGRKVVLVDPDTRAVTDLITNTAGLPASKQPYDTVALERPCDVKFGPDGSMYLLDFGRMDNDGPEPRYYPGTGAIFMLKAAR